MADFEVKFSEINKSFKLIESGSEGDSGTGLTDAAKQAMLQIARKVAYIDEHGQTYYDDLYDALYGITAVRLNRTSLVMAAIGSTSQLIATTTPAGRTVTWASSDTSVATVDSTGLVTSVALGSCTITATAGRVSATCAVSVVEATLVSIDAVYTQSGTVYDTAALDDLKTDLVVTASWSSGTTSEVASSNYSLSGTLTVGTSTVTVTYGECTDTFTVNVTAAPTLSSISAVYTQSGTVYDTDTLDSLKPDLVVTAHYSDQTTETVTSYTLSGTLTEGTSTVTVSYSGKTTTFAVTVTHYEQKSDMNGWTDGIPYTDLTIVENEYVDRADGSFDPYDGWNRTGYVPCDGASTLVIPQMSGSGGGSRYNAFYTQNHVFISAFEMAHTAAVTVNVPSNAYYFVLSEKASQLAQVISDGIVPHA